ncbi:SET domain-containing protein [Hyphopichia burtonii NRRL Y-1933]|uniref:SET domain-containing protein n=1 Tax=Hyphopichia burtonii NRRL Y-1933 TaxID=984485 RepID=A0A1E4RF09_9ASCO|nr:SET domain-containing protein [Hyphopichia burtonii NRRL Y-1933]ODV65830.1 SET domain-containing protein [Hyphopichia burtonii NRRL Y-1933]
MSSITGLVEWALENGAQIAPEIEFKEVGESNIGGVYKDANKKERVLQDGNSIKLPIKLAITLSNAIESFNKEDGTDFEDVSSKTLNTNSVLKLYLARERTSELIEKSFHKEYLKLLPGFSQMDSPYFWDAKDKAYLKGTNLGNSIKDNLGQLVEEWWQMINQLPEGIKKPTQHFVNMKFYYEFKFYTDDDLYKYFVSDEDVENWTSFANYLWASMILKSRSFPAYLLKDNIESKHTFRDDEVMLLPLIDLLNHNPKALVHWSVNKSDDQAYFNFKADQDNEYPEVFNNYGQKGNEELLLAYGFVIEGNPADTTALKIKLPIESLPGLEEKGVKFPKLSDYTTSVIRNDETETGKDNYKQYEDGIIFFISRTTVPDNLILLFQWLVKTPWEKSLTLRMKLAGINQLRQALDAKLSIINNIKIPTNENESKYYKTIEVYIKSQREIYSGSIKSLKKLEKELLADSKNKKRFVTLKNVYKKDIKFQRSLTVSLGVISYDTIVDSGLQDQVWLLYLIRCFNRDSYQEEQEDEQYIPEWITRAFKKMHDETEMSAQDVVNFKELYQGLIIPLNSAVPEIYNKGKWTVKELYVSGKLLDIIGFVRGKEQETILVEPTDGELD